MKLAGWGNFPVAEARVFAPRSIEGLRETLLAQPTVIARGSGRAYGDSALNASATIQMHHFNRMLAFDASTGQLVAEAGVTMGDIIAAFLPRGWFPMVTPGTKFVTIGGAIAADVHGKNHHKHGSFRTCVDWMDVMDAGGEIRRCSPGQDSVLFEYTFGGMGLTGIIVRAAIRLRPVESAWIRQRTIQAPDLHSAMQAFDDNEDTTYSVAWIDCLSTGRHLGRSLIMLGEHANVTDLCGVKAKRPFATPTSRKLRIPCYFPAILLNRYSIKAFNALYYRAGGRRKDVHLIDWDRYFYPLDAILFWNRIYGRRGFAQFQCVFPLDRSEAALSAVLEEISLAGTGSFLGVLKRFGPQESVFSFPMSGYTLALDFPITRGTLSLLERLDHLTLQFNGRFYLAKDSRMSADIFRASDPRGVDFQRTRMALGAFERFRSLQADRLGI